MTTTAPAAAPFWERVLPTSPSTIPLPSPEALNAIARDAAQRAADVLDGLPLISDPTTDLVRLLHGSTDTAAATEAAERAGLRPAELGRLRAAYTHGRAAAVHTMLHPADTDPQTLSTAAMAVEPHRRQGSTPLRTAQNSVTDDDNGLQIRLGPDDRWHPFTTGSDGWAPASGCSPEPASAYRAAQNAKQNRTPQLR